MIRTLALIACLAGAAHGIQYDDDGGIKYDGLRVKFGWSDTHVDIQNFFNIPRNISAAEAEGWLLTERPSGDMPDLLMYCPPGRGVCPLYHADGFVAGIMIAFPVGDYDTPITPDTKFVKWCAPAQDDEPAGEYWTATQYFVSEQFLECGGGLQVENGTTLQDDGVWVTGLDGQLLHIPGTQAELNNTVFKFQSCVSNMGNHYYYNMNEELACDDMLPWVALTLRGKLVATAFQVVGNLTQPQVKAWFESTDPAKIKRVVQIVIPDAPQCHYDWVDEYGLMSVHVYYVNDPWNIRCEDNEDKATEIKAIKIK